MTSLAEAIERFSAATERLAAATEGQLRRDRDRDRQERQADPEFRAQIEAIRRPVRKLSVGAFARASPESFAHFEHVVPANFYSGVDDGLYEVACPCGETHEVGGSFPHGAECGRYFMFFDEELRVAFSPKGTEPVPQEPLVD